MGITRAVRMNPSPRTVKISGGRCTGPKLPRNMRKRAKIDKQIGTIKRMKELLERFKAPKPDLTLGEIREFDKLIRVNARRNKRDPSDILRYLEKTEISVMLDMVDASTPEKPLLTSFDTGRLTGLFTKHIDKGEDLKHLHAVLKETPLRD